MFLIDEIPLHGFGWFNLLWFYYFEGLNGLNFNIYQPGYDGGSQYPDYFSPHDDANSIFTYSNGLNMGLSYTGDYRLVYTGTGLETFGSNSSSTAPNDINESQTVFLDRTLNYLNFINTIIHHQQLAVQNLQVELLSLQSLAFMVINFWADYYCLHLSPFHYHYTYQLP